MSHKIIRLSAENFKRLRAVDITPDPAAPVVQIRGPNGSGKSSVLDSIWAALGGVRDAVPPRPVRAGAERAEIRVELDDLVVTRRFVGDNTTLVVQARDTGARYPSPQAVLDRLVGAVAFDPLSFTRLPPREQMAQLRALVPLDVDVAALDAASAADYDRRRDINRDAARLRAQAQGIQVAPDVPAEPVDEDALVAQLRAIGDANAQIERVMRERMQYERDADTAAANARMARSRAAELHQEAERLLRRAENEDAAAKQYEQKAAQHAARVVATEVPEKQDAGPVAAALRAARETNAAVARQFQRTALDVQAAQLEQESAALTAAMERRDAEKRAALARARFPVPGLSFGPDGVLYHDVPFEQASQAEKIRVSAALAMAANPALRVLCVRDGSLLDAASLAQLTDLVREHDYQLWLEVTDDAATSGVVIEDGAVRAPATPEPVMEGFAE